MHSDLFPFRNNLFEFKDSRCVELPTPLKLCLICKDNMFAGLMLYVDNI